MKANNMMSTLVILQIHSRTGCVEYNPRTYFPCSLIKSWIIRKQNIMISIIEAEK